MHSHHILSLKQIPYQSQPFWRENQSHILVKPIHILHVLYSPLRLSFLDVHMHLAFLCAQPLKAAWTITKETKMAYGIDEHI